MNLGYDSCPKEVGQAATTPHAWCVLPLNKMSDQTKSGKAGIYISVCV